MYVPGANSRALEKARSLPADILIFDLEDAVAPEHKDGAREAVVAAVRALANDRREIVVRINDLDTPWAARDIAAMVAAGPDVLLLPKVSRADDIRRARSALSAANASKATRLWAMLESPQAILNAAAIAAVSAIPEPSVTGFVVGTNDLAADLRAPTRAGRPALLPHLSHAILVARAHNLVILDGTFNDIEDRRALRIECQQGRDMGFDGKTLIHPGQIIITNEVFSPDPEEIAWAQRVVDAFSSPDNTGLEVMRLAGRMVERLHERQAKRTLQMAEAIAALDEWAKLDQPALPPRTVPFALKAKA